MAVTSEFKAYVEELFSVVPGSSVRRMFGGLGVFRRGLMFGLSLDDGRIALKADEVNSPDFSAEGSTQWIYEAKGRRRMSMGYWYLPERLLDEPEEFKAWAEKAFDAAMRADSRKPAGKRKLKAGSF